MASNTNGLYNVQYREHNWDKIEEKSPTEYNITFTHKDNGIRIFLSHKADKTLVFKILDGAIQVGDGHRYIENILNFIQDFIYEGKFVMFLANKKMRKFY